MQNKTKSNFFRHQYWWATISYVLLVVFINLAYAYFPAYSIGKDTFSSADCIAGLIYLVRDFAQREIKHGIFIAMIFASVVSYLLAKPSIAIASISAFVVGELLDWAIFTFTQRPLSQRLLLSSLLSSPIDSVIFLMCLSQLNFLSFTLMNISKAMGIFCLWLIWSIMPRSSTYA